MEIIQTLAIIVGCLIGITVGAIPWYIFIQSIKDPVKEALSYWLIFYAGSLILGEILGVAALIVYLIGKG